MPPWLPLAAVLHGSWRRLAIVGLVSLLALQLSSFHVQLQKMKRIIALNLHPFHELEHAEEMVLLPPQIDLNEVYLHPSNSSARNIFFPTSNAMDPRKGDGYFYPGRVWLDTNGNPIQAHGGGILVDEKSGVYYWYGEYKDGPTYRSNKGVARVDVIGVGCYSSTDLWSWKHEGIVLGAEENDESHDLHRTKVLERPKVVYNERTKKYVMWMHVDDQSYDKAGVGIAVSDSPIGPFQYLKSLRPNGYDSRDMTVFKDDDGMAYLIYSSNRNKEMHISAMNQDYQGVENKTIRVLTGQYREAPALFKHNSVYYMVTSGCSGWAPNEAMVHEAESVFGPWESIGNPNVGANKEFRVATFFSQGTHVIPMPGESPGSFIFMADRWRPDDLRDSRYVWLPMVVKGRRERYVGLPLSSKVSIFWHKKWRIPVGNGKKVN